MVLQIIGADVVIFYVAIVTAVKIKSWSNATVEMMSLKIAI